MTHHSERKKDKSSVMASKPALNRHLKNTDLYSEQMSLAKINSVSIFTTNFSVIECISGYDHDT